MAFTFWYVKRQRAAQAPAAPAEAPRRVQPEETGVVETVSVVLRRQIPPRFEEPPRSWLGGLPRMPVSMEWPKSVSSEYPERGSRPLHFVAQIACADLPRKLWGGLGPREGWLLLFLDPNQGVPEGPDAFRVVYIGELGPERAAPEDLGPVYDGVYTGPDYRYLLLGEAIPNRWRRWPVDLFTVPNEARVEERRTLVAPENFAALLYPGERVVEGRPRLPPARPLTTGQALYALDELEKKLHAKMRDFVIPEPLQKQLDAPDGFATIRQQCARDLADRKAKLEAMRAEAPQGAHLERFERLIAQLEGRDAWLDALGSTEAIRAYLEESPALERARRTEALAEVEIAKAELLTSDPDTALSAEEWQALVERFSPFRLERWKWLEHRDAPPFLSAESADLHPPAAMRELLADFYVDPDAHDRIPEDIRTDAEAYWRQLYNNRPHRMGGYHDGLQSDAVIGPSKSLLLFQIATDDAMHWVWGDAGAYYFWIQPKDLEARDFSKVEMWLECH